MKTRAQLEGQIDKLMAELEIAERRAHDAEERAPKEVGRFRADVRALNTKLSNAETRLTNLDIEMQHTRATLAQERRNVAMALAEIASLNAKRESDARLLAALYIALQASMERKA